jgi:alanyl-tRNA synthetase
MVSGTSFQNITRHYQGMAAILGGTGGGKPDLAQAGGKDPGKLDAALAALPRIIEKTAK